MGQSAPSSLGNDLEERYFLQKVKLGQGSFGSVYRAVDRQKNRTVAIKQLEKDSLPKRGVTKADILREIDMMRACPHENITQLFDTFEDDLSIYLALEYCDGGDFGDKVKERGMAATEPEVAEWMRQMCAAINAMHQKRICHRDVKPDNFMVQSEASMLKLSDFGLAVYVPEGSRLFEKCGTPAFMAPEQHKLPRESPGYSLPCDIWAVGVSMYMMMFGGKHPFLTDRGGLDDGALLRGDLDFREKPASVGFFGFAGLGGSPLRYSEEARGLCQSMVQPNQDARVTARALQQSLWLQQRREVKQEGGGGGYPGAPGSSPHGPPVAVPAAPGVAPSRDRPEDFPRRASGRRETEAVAAAPVPRSGTRTPPGGFGADEEDEDERGGASHRARTPGPEGRKALEQAAKLEAANQALLSELEERKRREEELLLEKERIERKQKIFERQRTKELEEYERRRFQHERELRAIEEEKRELERLRWDQTAAAAAAASALDATNPGVRGRGLHKAAVDRTTANGHWQAGDRSAPLLAPGTRCRYESITWGGWTHAIIQGYNDVDDSYNLDIKPHVPMDKISPLAETKEAEAWPPGTLAFYLSCSANKWLPAKVVSFNECDGTYNLDVRDHAEVDRIRPRTTHSSVPGSGGAASSKTAADERKPQNAQQTAMNHYAAGQEGGASGSRSRGRPEDFSRDRAESRKVTQRPSEMETGQQPSAAGGGGGGGAIAASSLAPRWVNRGDVAWVAEHGLVHIESSVDRDGCYAVRNDKGRTSVQSDRLRAPKETRYAWPPGTQVAYLSASVGKWIDTVVLSFNGHNNTYNLEVRQEADPDKIRPR